MGPNAEPPLEMTSAIARRETEVAHRETEVVSRDQLEKISLVLAGLALFGILYLHILSSLLGGMMVYLIVQSTVPAMRTLGLTRRTGKALVLLLVVTLIGVGVVYGVGAIMSLATDGSDSVVVLLRQMADVVSTSRDRVPVWAQGYIPASMQDLEASAARWLREHAGQIGVIGQDLGKFLFHLVMGMIIGGVIAFYRGIGEGHTGPLSRVMIARISVLSVAFRNVVFSQIRISALNTILTAIYLAGVLPMLGVQLPLLKTMIAVTFFVGLIPILGNLISNTVIVIVSLSVSPMVAVGSLAFLVIIHKLEYFVNARIIGSRIKARAWELLTAMLVMEAAFGIPGLIAAPIYYAYLKDELSARGMI
jgi:predicted PurR-regulated permease PerM